MESSLRRWYGNGVRLGARGVGGCDRAFLNSLRVLLVPAPAQVCFVNTERRIMGADIGTSTIVCYNEFRRFRNE